MIFVLISIIIAGADLWIKHYIEKTEVGPDKKEIFHGRLLIQKSHNTGAMMNLLDKRQELVAGFSAGLFACIAIAYLYLLGRKGMYVLKTGASFLVGGAASNVYDRLVRKYVVDYFSFNTKNKKIRKVVFNIADMFVFLGSFLVILWNAHHKS